MLTNGLCRIDAPKETNPATDPTPDLLPDALRCLAALLADGKPLRVLIERDGLSAELRIGPAQPEVAAIPRLKEIEAAILAAFHDEQELVTGEKLSERTIYPYASHFKSALARLHKAKLLMNHAPGYSRAPAGTFALEQHKPAD